MKLPTPNEFAAAQGYKPFPPHWEKWLNAVREGIIGAQPTAGKHTTISEHKGKGTVVNSDRVTTAAAPSCSCLCIDTAVISVAGSSYKVGDNLSPAGDADSELCDPFDSAGFQLHVDAVDGSGAVTAFTIVSGLGYNIPPANPISFFGSATGTGFKANCAFSSVVETLPAPTPIDITFNSVIFDCGCITSGATSRIVTAGTFNSNTRSWHIISQCCLTGRWSFGTCTTTVYPVHEDFYSGSSCAGSPTPVDQEVCNIQFFLRNGLYRLKATDLQGGLIFDGTTTDLSLPIANTVSCGGTNIAHGGTATVTI